MRFWAVALWLLTLLPVLGDSSDVAMGAKSAAVMSASDGQVPEVTKNTVTDAESDSGNGILFSFASCDNNLLNQTVLRKSSW